MNSLHLPVDHFVLSKEAVISAVNARHTICVQLDTRDFRACPRNITPARSIPFDGTIEQVFEAIDGNWTWAANARCKYMWVEKVDNILYVLDRDQNPLSLADIKFQLQHNSDE